MTGLTAAVLWLGLAAPARAERDGAPVVPRPSTRPPPANGLLFSGRSTSGGGIGTPPVIHESPNGASDRPAGA